MGQEGKLFISYSHKDEEWKDRLMPHLQQPALKERVNAWHDRDIKPGAPWFTEIVNAIDNAHIALLLIGKHFLASEFIQTHEVPRIRERMQNDGLRVIPLILSPCGWKNEKWLSSLQAFPTDGEPLSGKNGNEIETDMAALADRLCDVFKGADCGAAGANGVSGEQETFKPLPPGDIYLSKLPVTGDVLFGRDVVLAELDEAWKNNAVNVLTLTAWGGVGKTALVNQWLNRMGLKNYRGAERVYGWSFYSQGAEEGKQVSADEFMQKTLAWFGDGQPAEGSAVDKGRRLTWTWRWRDCGKRALKNLLFTVSCPVPPFTGGSGISLMPGTI